MIARDSRDVATTPRALKDFLSVLDFDPADLERCLELSAQLKADRSLGRQSPTANALDGRHEVSRADSKLVLTGAGSAAELADVFARLRDGGIEPTGFAKQLPSLDDAFFKILDDQTEAHHADAH